QSHFKFDRFDQSPVGSFESLAPLRSGHVMRKSPTSYHRRTVSCLAVASHHEHYDHPWYCSSNSRFYDTLEIAEGSASPVHQTRHAKRKSEGSISLEHLQKSLSGAGVANVNASSDKSKNEQVGDCRMAGVLSGPLGGKKKAYSSTAQSRPIQPSRYGNSQTMSALTVDATWNARLLIQFLQKSQKKQNSPLLIRPSSNPECSYIDCSHFQKLAVSSPVTPPRRSLLSDLLSSQGGQSRLEQNANRRRMLKSMRRYSVDASEMDFSVSRPSSRFKHLEGIPSEEEGASTLLVDGGRQGFSSTPTVRYLRNPCHAAVKTKLLPSAYRGTHVRRGGASADDETPDYFGADDRVW
ncbi:hypothetical protein KVV02_000700, partial [Mortierella alpina]